MDSSKKATIYDVAKKAQVSLATVSRVLNGASSVSPKTVNKVRQAIDELDYVPSAIARGLATDNTTTIGLIVSGVADYYFSELVQGINDIAKIYKYDVILSNSDIYWDEDDSEDSFSRLQSRRIDGLIIVAEQINPKFKKAIDALKIPSVVIGGKINTQLHQVTIDLFQTTLFLANYLVDQNAQKVALVSHEVQYQGNQACFDGFKSIFKDEDGHSIFEVEQNTYDEGYELGPKLKEFDGVVTSGDQLASGILAYALDHKIKVPQDLKIVTTQDTKIAQMVRPQLSSISFSKYDIGAIAMRMLTKLMSGDPLEQNQVIVPFDFVERESSKK
jgi:LacI family transcriptional regulator